MVGRGSTSLRWYLRRMSTKKINTPQERPSQIPFVAICCDFFFGTFRQMDFFRNL
jgi:hypothetical protein